MHTQKHTRPNQAVYELVLVAVRMENFQCIQRKCQGPLQLLSLFSHDQHQWSNCKIRAGERFPLPSLPSPPLSFFLALPSPPSPLPLPLEVDSLKSS